MTIEWEEIEKSLTDFYKEIQLEVFPNEFKYLKNAFSFTEELWEKQFKKIDSVKYVMISEAPLFGESQNYFYNPSTKFSSFFYFRNIEAFNISYSKNNYNNKEFVLDILNEKGFLILDLFPFALNKDFTQINYNSLKHQQYQKLFQIVVQTYLNKKLVLIKNKCNNETVFVYRYKRLKDKLSGVLEKELVKFSVIERNEDLDTLNNNMSLDKEKLRKILLR